MRSLSLPERVAAVKPVQVQGTFYRHAGLNRDAFAGGDLGRWGRNFPVIYLGRPPDSVTIEAYRHLVEADGIPVEMVQPRRLYTITVDVERVLDLTISTNVTAVGLTTADLQSDVDDYEACQRVAAAAHQLELHAIQAPAAAGFGITLAMFRERVSLSELPHVQYEETWEKLPPDPRSIRVLQGGQSA